jgi:hypothetical protein
MIAPVVDPDGKQDDKSTFKHIIMPLKI